MKKFLFVLLTVSSIISFAQVPQKLNYQAVARNVSGNPLPNQFIKVQISIRDGSPNALIVYQERDTATTNQFGLFTVSIGTGQVQVGTDLTAINWATGNKFMQVEFDPTGGNSFTDMGTNELVSVPYALYAANSGNSSAWSNYAVYSETQLNNVQPQTVLIDSTWQPRLLNTTEDSAGTSISRNGNQITLLPGKYHISASAQWGVTIANINVNNVEMSNVYARSLLSLKETGNTIRLLGQAEFESILFIPYIPNIAYIPTTSSPIESYPVSLEGVVSISAATTLTLQHYISYPVHYLNTYAVFTANAGIPMGLGLPNEVYSRILIQKID